jgi:hypothetical protein
MHRYRVQVTAQLTPLTALDEARLRAATGATLTRVASDIVRIELVVRGRDPVCAAERALPQVFGALGPSVRCLRPAVWIARRTGVARLLPPAGGSWPVDGDDDGLGGVREPRRPVLPTLSAAAARDLPAA